MTSVLVTWLSWGALIAAEPPAKISRDGDWLMAGIRAFDRISERRRDGVS